MAGEERLGTVAMYMPTYYAMQSYNQGNYYNLHAYLFQPAAKAHLQPSTQLNGAGDHSLFVEAQSNRGIIQHGWFNDVRVKLQWGEDS